MAYNPVAFNTRWQIDAFFRPIEILSPSLVNKKQSSVENSSEAGLNRKEKEKEDHVHGGEAAIEPATQRALPPSSTPLKGFMPVPAVKARIRRRQHC